MGKLISALLDDFQKQHPLYGEIKFEGENGSPEFLHPIFTFTQYIINQFIARGENRIAIVLPDNETSIIPMVIMHCFDCILNEEDYSGNLLDDLKKGDRLRINNAVVEFYGLDPKSKTIEIIIDKSGRIKEIPVSVPALYNAILNAEKTKAELTSFDRWKDARKAVLNDRSEADLLTNIKSKRTLLNKTIIFMTPKNDLRELFEDVKVGGVAIEEILSFGKINLNKEQKYELYNGGKLAGIPAITATSDMEDTADAVKKVFPGKINCIFVSPEKSGEVAEDSYNLKKCLKENIPMVVFLYEKDLENYKLLNGYDFKIWHWKPSTIKSEAFMTDSEDKKEVLFGTLSRKINCASFAEIKTIAIEAEELKDCGEKLFAVSSKYFEYAAIVRKTIGVLWKIYKDYERVCYIDEETIKEIIDKITEVENIWSDLSNTYEGQQIVEEVYDIISSEFAFIKASNNRKQDQIVKRLEDCKDPSVVIMPDGYPHMSAVKKFVAQVSKGKSKALTLSEFQTKQSKCFETYNTLLVPWFDKDCYTEIKQLYCYDTLLFILYDFEDKRRRRLIRENDAIVPHEKIKVVAEELNIVDNDYSEQSIDDITDEYVADENRKNEEVEKEFSVERIDFRSTVRRNIFSGTFKSASAKRDSNSLEESVLVLFDNDRYAYFYPKHKVITVTRIVNRVEDVAYVKEARYLKTGDVIAVSSGDKDIVREIADKMMKAEGKEGMRDIAVKWHDILAEVAKGHSVKEIAEILNNYDADCSEQQCRIWLIGETVMPRGVNVLYAIGKAARAIPGKEEVADLFLSEIEKIYRCGSEIHGYHQSAGREMRRRLAQKAEEIRKCAANGMEGSVEGIGEIKLYKVEDIDSEKYYIEWNKLNKIEEE